MIKIIDIGLEFLDHHESRVRQSAGVLISKGVKKMAQIGDEVFLKVYEQLIQLIIRDLARDAGAADQPENEAVRQKILEGQQARGISSKVNKYFFAICLIDFPRFIEKGFEKRFCNKKVLTHREIKISGNFSSNY